MTWMELIVLRAPHREEAQILGRLAALASSISEAPGLVAVSTHKHATLSGDFAVLLTWNEPLLSTGSEVGLHVRETLTQIGLVDHAVWSKQGE